MPAHDDYLRLTPYERLLPDESFASSTFTELGTELERHPEAADDPGAFALLERTRRALAELRDPDTGVEDQGATHALLLFHAFHLFLADTPHLLVTVPVSRWAVEGEGSTEGMEEGAESGLPGAAYVQLPQHLFWFRDQGEDRPVSLDGFFWTRRGAVVHLLGVGGLQGPTGPGFRVLPLPGVPRSDAPLWLAETMREDGEDFRSDIPGAELEGLYELRTTGELLKLAARIDRFVAQFDGAAGEPVEPDPGKAGATGPESGKAEATGPEPGRVPYIRLTL